MRLSFGVVFTWINYLSAASMSFMNKIFPPRNGMIPVDKEGFLAGLKDEVINTSHEHLNLRIKVERAENDLSIKTARRIGYPLDTAVLFGRFQLSDNSYYFNYTIRPRKLVFALIPWFLLVFIFIGFSIVISITFNLTGLLFAALFAFAFVHAAKYHMKIYNRDAKFLEDIISRIRISNRN
jgi:hypothetical protein